MSKKKNDLLGRLGDLDKDLDSFSISDTEKQEIPHKEISTSESDKTKSESISPRLKEKVSRTRVAKSKSMDYDNITTSTISTIVDYALDAIQLEMKKSQKGRGKNGIHKRIILEKLILSEYKRIFGKEKYQELLKEIPYL